MSAIKLLVDLTRKKRDLTPPTIIYFLPVLAGKTSFACVVEFASLFANTRASSEFQRLGLK